MICLPLVEVEMELSFLVWTTLICIIKHHTLYHLWLPNWLNWLWNLPQTFLDSSWIKLKGIKYIEEENVMAIQFPTYKEKVHFQSFFNVENLVAYPSLVFYFMYIVHTGCLRSKVSKRNGYISGRKHFSNNIGKAKMCLKTMHFLC